MASDALVVTGGGVGNLIQSTPLIVAAAHLHNRPVDVWLAKDSPKLADVIRGHEDVRRVSHLREEAMGPVKKYAAVYYTFLRKGAVAQQVQAAWLKKFLPLSTIQVGTPTTLATRPSARCHRYVRAAIRESRLLRFVAMIRFQRNYLRELL